MPKATFIDGLTRMLMSKNVNNDVTMNPPINARDLLLIGLVAQLVSAGRSNSEIASSILAGVKNFSLIPGLSSNSFSFKNMQLRKKKGVNCWKMTGITAVSDNTRPALSKTFQDFGLFFDVNQTVSIASNRCLSNKGSNSVLK